MNSCRQQRIGVQSLRNTWFLAVDARFGYKDTFKGCRPLSYSTSPNKMLAGKYGEQETDEESPLNEISTEKHQTTAEKKQNPQL